MATTLTNGTWRRIGDAPFGLGIERFEDSNKNGLWRLRVTRGPGRGDDILVDGDARLADLAEIKRFCDYAIELIQSDGGRRIEDRVAQSESSAAEEA